MNMRQNIIAALLGAGLTVASASAHAGTIDIDLGASSEDFTLYGMGASWTYPAFVESVFDFTLPALRTEAG
jgi:hypothetical protein